MGLSKKSNFLLDRAPQKSVNASRAALRLPAHDSEPGWLATPYLYDSCIRNFTPVYPGALQFRPKFPRLRCQDAPRFAFRPR